MGSVGPQCCTLRCFRYGHSEIRSIQGATGGYFSLFSTIRLSGNPLETWPGLVSIDFFRGMLALSLDEEYFFMNVSYFADIF